MSTNGEAVLERMGLNGGAIRNVMMHRDLVPRAFSCDYTLVADLLARVSDSFRNLESLRGPHRRVSKTHFQARGSHTACNFEEGPVWEQLYWLTDEAFQTAQKILQWVGCSLHGIVFATLLLKPRT